MIRVKQVAKTSLGFPSQWEGLTESGKFLYIRFRHGSLSVHLADKEENLFTPQSEIILIHNRGGFGDGEMDTEDMIETTKEVMDFSDAQITEMHDPLREECQQQAVFRYTWPGRDEACICLEHAMQMRGVSEAMGFKLQFIPLSGQEQMTATCSQNVKEEAKDK